jgi:hypothetical protein
MVEKLKVLVKKGGIISFKGSVISDQYCAEIVSNWVCRRQVTF